jgi:amino acid transporter
MSTSHNKPNLMFASGALFNLCAGLPLLLAPALASQLMTIPVTAGNYLFMQIAGMAIIGFGWIYWLIAREPQRYRPLILLGLLLKIGVVLLVYSYCFMGVIGWQLPALAFGDVIYAGLFAYYLQTTKAAGAQGL